MMTNSCDMVSVKDYGAVGDGTTNDLSAIEDAAAIAVTLEKPLYFPPAENGYAISAGITLSHLIDVVFNDSFLLYAGSSDEAALTIGAPGEVGYGRRYADLAVQRAAVSDWLSEDNVGIRVLNPDHCNITIRKAVGFTIGCQFSGDGGGAAYNDVKLFLLNNNKVGLDLTNDNGGWCNENIFRSGRFSNDTGINSTLSRIGIRVRTQDSYINNSLVFDKPSLELTNGGMGEALGVLIEAGSQVFIREARDEGNDVFLRVTGDSDSIHASTGFSNSGGFDPVVEVLGRYPSVFVSSGRSAVHGRGPSSWESRPGWEAYQASSSTYALAGLSVNSWYYDTMLPADDELKPTPDYLELSGTKVVARELDTRVTKLVKISRSVDAARPGRLVVRCLDEDGNVVSGASDERVDLQAYALGERCYFTEGPTDDIITHIYLECTVAGTSGSVRPSFPHTAGEEVVDGTVTWTVRHNPARGDVAQFGNVYNQGYLAEGSDNDLPVLLGFREDVKRAIIGLGAGANECHMKGGFAIQSMDGGPILTTNPIRGQADRRLAVSVPTEGGYFGGGEFLFRSPATSSEPIGWGVATPGWATSAAWAATTGYVVGDIRHNSGNVYIVEVAGTSAGSGGPTTAALAITDGSVTWRYVAPRATFVAGPDAP